MKGRIVLVTGSTHGIGRAAALELARLGATVVLGCRDIGRGEETAASIKRTTGNPDVHVLCGDLSSRRSTREFAAAFRRRFPALHVLLNNAGAVVPTRRLSEEGVEMTFALNHLGYFHLTSLLLDSLKAGAPSRIVNVASETHRYVRPEFDDSQNSRRYSPLRAYGKSKLANILFTRELARRLEGSGITANAVHPGGVRSNFYSNASGINLLYFKLFRWTLITPEKGAETLVYLASSDEVEGITGCYFINKRPVRSSDASMDPDLAKKLWGISEKMVGD